MSSNKAGRLCALIITGGFLLALAHWVFEFLSFLGFAPYHTWPSGVPRVVSGAYHWTIATTGVLALFLVSLIRLVKGVQRLWMAWGKAAFALALVSAACGIGVLYLIPATFFFE